MYKLGVVWGTQGSLEVIGNVTIRQSTYDFLFDFNRNHASILCRFRDIAGYLCDPTFSRFRRTPTCDRHRHRTMASTADAQHRAVKMTQRRGQFRDIHPSLLMMYQSGLRSFNGLVIQAQSSLQFLRKANTGRTIVGLIMSERNSTQNKNGPAMQLFWTQPTLL